MEQDTQTTVVDQTNQPEQEEVSHRDAAHIALSQSPYASFGVRLVAIIIDAAIIAAVNACIAYIFLLFGFPMDTVQDSSYLNILSIFIFLVYFSYMESSVYQATYGKKIMGIKVTDMNGNRISYMRALGRTAAKYISGFIIFIGYLLALFTEKHQALHDIIAGTLVVKK